MTAADTEAMTALQELLDERQRYEGWIATLELRKSSTAPHVYSRVHTDYTLRLERVLHRLSERTEQLQSTVQLMASRLASLRNREADRTDARQEAELRAAVGEYADEEWAILRDDADREIASITQERLGVEAELAEIERIVEMTRTSQVETAEAAAAAAEVSATVGEGDTPVSNDVPRSIKDFVAGGPVRLTDSAPPVVVSGVSGVAAPKVVVLESTEGAKSQTTLSSSAPPTQLEAPAPIVEPKREGEKTLKCPECGGLNYATEWYCERCGGELATF